MPFSPVELIAKHQKVCYPGEEGGGTVEKMRQFYAFHLSSLFIMIKGLFLDKMLFDWTLETPTFTSTKFAIKKVFRLKCNKVLTELCLLI